MYESVHSNNFTANEVYLIISVLRTFLVLKMNGICFLAIVKKDLSYLIRTQSSVSSFLGVLDCSSSGKYYLSTWHDLQTARRQA